MEGHAPSWPLLPATPECGPPYQEAAPWATSPCRFLTGVVRILARHAMRENALAGAKCETRDANRRVSLRNATPVGDLDRFNLRTVCFGPHREIRPSGMFLPLLASRVRRRGPAGVRKSSGARRGGWHGACVGGIISSLGELNLIVLRGVRDVRRCGTI